MNKEGNNNYYKYILLTLVLLCVIFRYKNINIEPNKILELSISNIIYPFTFLLTLFIFNKSKFKDAHNNIIKCSLTILVFILIVTILINIPSAHYSKEIDVSLKQIITPNYFFINDTVFYYPNVLDIITYSLLFYFSHTLVMILYEAIRPYTKEFITVALAMFIPYTLDIICQVTIHDTFNGVELNTLITHLTSNFVVIIIGTLLVSTIYTIKKVRTKSL